MPPLRVPTQQRQATRLAPQSTRARPLVPLRAPAGSSRAACFAPEAAAAGIYTLEAPPRLLDLDLAPPSPPPAVVAPPPPALDTDEPAPIVELTPDSFHDYLKDRDIVVVDFYTDWCGPCKVMSKEFEKFPKAFKTVAFAKMNCGRGHEEFATRHRIRSLPTFRLYRRGLFVEEITGGRPVQLRQMVLHHSLR